MYDKIRHEDTFFYIKIYVLSYKKRKTYYKSNSFTFYVILFLIFIPALRLQSSTYQIIQNP